MLPVAPAAAGQRMISTPSGCGCASLVKNRSRFLLQHTIGVVTMPADAFSALLNPGVVEQDHGGVQWVT